MSSGTSTGSVLVSDGPPRSRQRAHAPASRWRRLLTPSLSDVLFVFLVVWIFIVREPGWSVLLNDGDTGWHIRVGESILSTGSVPHTDPFSFSKPDAPWYAWEWLSEVLMALVYGQLGLHGIVLAGGLMVSLFGVLFLRFMLWSGANTLFAVIITLLGVGASSVHFLARPHLFTFIFLIAALWLLEADRRHPGRRVWLLVPLTALWVNLHGGFLVLLVATGGLTAGMLLEGLLDSRDRAAKWRGALRYGLLTASCLAASVLNPYGLELHKHIAAYLQSDWIKTAVNEFQSPSFRAENVMQYEIVLLLGLMAAGLCAARRRMVEAIWILAWAHLSLSSARHIPIFVIFAGPLAAVEVTRLWNSWVERTGRGSVAGTLNQLACDLKPGFRRASIWPAVFILGLVFSAGALSWPQDFPDYEFPIAMIERHEDAIRGSRILADDQWADYLIFRFYPEQRVFMDGRSDFYGPEIGDKYLAVLYGKPEWKEILEEFQFEAVLIPPRRPLAALLQTQSDWVLVDRDEDAALFLRKR